MFSKIVLKHYKQIFLVTAAGHNVCILKTFKNFKSTVNKRLAKNTFTIIHYNSL
jgi:hypothetical protein